jgi:hypothetical protein
MSYSGGERTGLPFLDVIYKIEQYARSLQLPFAVFLHTVFFYENLITKKGSKRVTADQGLILIRLQVYKLTCFI